MSLNDLIVWCQKKFSPLNVFMSTEQISHLLEIMGNFHHTCILSTVCMYRSKLFHYFWLLCCVCVCASSVEMRCLCTKIYLGRKWCTKGDLCKFFIVLWYTEIFLNAYLNDLYTFANAMMKRDSKRKGPRVQNMHKCADWCCCSSHCYIVVYSNVLSITNMFWAQFFSICLPRLSPPSSVWCYFVMFHTVNKWQLTRYI